MVVVKGLRSGNTTRTNIWGHSRSTFRDLGERSFMCNGICVSYTHKQNLQRSWGTVIPEVIIENPLYGYSFSTKGDWILTSPFSEGKIKSLRSSNHISTIYSSEKRRKWKRTVPLSCFSVSSHSTWRICWTM